HHDDGATQIGRGQVAYVDPVQSHVPVGGVVEPGDELGYRGLSRAGGADQGDRLTGRDVQVEVWQHRRAVAVLEAHMVQVQLPAWLWQRRRTLRLDHARLLGQQPGDLLQRRRGGLEGVVEHADL